VDRRARRQKLPVSIERPRVDFHGFAVDDVYVFGCGMDYKGYWRGLRARMPSAQRVSNDLALIVGSGLRSCRCRSSRAAWPRRRAARRALRYAVQIGAQRVLCLPRHGERHAIAPHEINYRANRWALRQHGVRRCVASRGQGDRRAMRRPGCRAQQLIDYDRAHRQLRRRGAVVHRFHGAVRRGVAQPVAAAMPPAAMQCIKAYTALRKARLETAAEVDRLARDGCTMVGMTACPGTRSLAGSRSTVRSAQSQ
jgi:purine nucleoside phosphorylase